MNRHLTASVAVALSAALISSCTIEEPEPVQPANREAAVTIAYTENSMPALVLAEFYSQVFAAEGRPVQRQELSDDTLLNALTTGEVDFIIGCTGRLLEELNPQLAREWEEDLAEPENPTEAAELSDEVYEDFVGSLPAHLTATDPSPAEECSQTATRKLPQNVVPVFHATLLKRGEYTAINDANRYVTSEDIDSMSESAGESGKASDPENIAAAVHEWVRENNIDAVLVPVEEES